jgi:hypothetical protein
MKCDFSYTHYLEILEKFKEKGYQFGEFNKIYEGKVVHLRHDLDHSIEKAVPLADVERVAGATSTYCLRLASPFDNIFSRRNQEAIKKILDRGHCLALHFEREAWNGLNIENEILSQLKLLRMYFPVEQVVSFHRPQGDIFNKEFSQFTNTYEQRYFGDVVYLSDSTGRWRSGCPCENLEKESEKNYQLLTHPIWWGRDELRPCTHLHNFFREKIKEWDQEYFDDNPFYIERLDENN